MNTHDLALKAANGMLSFDAEGEWRLNQKEVERFAHLVRAEDEVLLRQALEALELRCGTNAGERKELIPALRERLGETK